MLASLAFLLSSSKMCANVLVSLLSAFLPHRLGLRQRLQLPFWVLLHVLCRLPGRKPCGSSMETWCVCAHGLCRRCHRLSVFLRPDRKPCGGSCVCERLQPGRKPCGSSIVCWCVSVHLLCRRCLRLCMCYPGGVVSGLLWLVPGLLCACSGTSDQGSVLCFVDTSQLSWWWGMPF